MDLQLEESLFVVVGCKSNVAEKALERLSRRDSQKPNSVSATARTHVKPGRAFPPNTVNKLMTVS
jgi:hypothetical protein